VSDIEVKGSGKWVRLAALWKNEDKFGVKLVSNNFNKDLGQDGSCRIEIRDNESKVNGSLDLSDSDAVSKWQKQQDYNLLVRYADIDDMISYLCKKKEEHEKLYEGKL